MTRQGARGGGRSFNGNWRDRRTPRRGGPKPSLDPYLHFTLYKENKDTMDAINHIARMLKIKSSNFGFAGTKDRRAATTQRMSVFHQGTSTDSLNWLNSKAPNIKVGDFSYAKNPIQLGQHGGNDFVIVVKNIELTRGSNCSLEHRLRMTENCVQSALDHVLEHGFINYFGLQRFGTHTIGTQEIGMKILKGDYKGAIDAILHVDASIVSSMGPDQESGPQRDEVARGRAIAVWRTSGNVEAALNIMPKRYNAETIILRHLSRGPESHRDYCGALLQITRGLRNLYIHAYQSYVWNWIVSTRWAKHGPKVIKGDLILVVSESNPARFRQGKDMSDDINQDEEEFYQEARHLSAAEAASGKYSIFDIVLPVPGYDCLYPDNDIRDAYVEFMSRPENGSLDPYNMIRRQREFSLSGHYRKIIARFTATPKFLVRPYVDDAEQMHPTDLDEIRAKKEEEKKQREATRTATSSWKHFAGNATEFDDADLEERRRRRVAERSQEPPEMRINDMWIETAPEKRMKVDRHRSTYQATVADENTEPELASWKDVKPQWQDTKAAVSVEDDTAKTTTSSLHPGDSVSNHGAASDEATVPLTAFGISVLDGIADPVHPAPVPSLESRLKVEGPYNPVPGFDDPTGKPLPLSAKLVEDISKSFMETETLESPAPATLGTAAAKANAILPTTSNVFKDQAATGDGSDGRAVDLTPDWRGLAPEADMKVAVILNFRLSSSNYATICLRELMSAPSDEDVNVTGPTPPAALVPSLAPPPVRITPSSAP